jgi:hypothetical protein
MFKRLLSKSSNKDTKTSDFSRFFRDASSREKKKVFLDAAREASKEQRDLMQQPRFSR